MLKGMKKAISIATSMMVLLSSVTVTVAEELPNVKVFIVGDSTACEYGYDENYAIPRNGWGMQLDKFLNDKAEVINLAKSGRSSKSFAQEEEYDRLLNEVGENDYVLIQFGHNDEKKSSEEDLATRYTDPDGDKDTEGSFKNSLYVNYILKVKEKDAIPMLISPIVRRNFNEDGTVADTHERYDDCVRELAEETGVELIDMTEITADIYNKAGEENSKLMHAVYNSREKGADGIDNTHLNRIGATVVASYLVREIEKKDLSLSAYADLSATAVEAVSYTSRGQFVQDIIRLTQLTEQGKDNFSDVTGSEPYAQAVAAAKATGIARGDENAVFNGERELTYGEALLFMQRALYAAGVDISMSGSDANYEQQVEGAFNALLEIEAIPVDTVIEDFNDRIDSTDAMYLCVKTYEEITEALEMQAETSQTIDEIEKVE